MAVTLPTIRRLHYFSTASTNPLRNKLILLTKTANTHYLADICPEHRQNIVVSFSLNPEAIADLWEGKWPDTGERITPPIAKRLQAAKLAQDLGFEIRVRVDPILTPEGWEDQYAAFNDWGSKNRLRIVAGRNVLNIPTIAPHICIAINIYKVDRLPKLLQSIDNDASPGP